MFKNEPRFAPTLVGAGITLLAVSITIWLAYTQVLPGSYFFDDEFNLGGLSEVNDFYSGLLYSLSANQLPGRPLALATFALQAQAWTDHPENFLRVNFLIHILAVWSSFMLAVGLWRVRHRERWTPALWFGVGVAALWGLSPFLATTHLMIVQRMTGLAGLFTLFGLTAFVWAHVIGNARTRIYVFVLLGFTGLATILATLAKENGILLPLLALVILWLWIPKNLRLENPRDRKRLLLLLLLPSVALALYMGYMLLTYLQQGYEPHRYFTPYQRLLSQPIILLDYLRQLLLPQSFSVTPYMDRYPAPSGWLEPPITLVALIAWLAGIVTAFKLRKILPALAFGIVFFLVGHLIESTYIDLELYFAHRNYVPSFGLYFALVYSLVQIPRRFAKLTWIAFSLYMALFCLVLFQVTTGWNRLHIATGLWLDKNPYSERAAQAFANQLISQGEFIEARKVFDEAVTLNPEIALLQIQRTQLCKNQEEQYPILLDEVERRLRNAAFHQNAVTELFRVALYHKPNSKLSQSCPPRGYDTFARLAQALLDNPAYTENDFARGYLLATLGVVAARGDGDLERASDLLEEAFQTYPAQDFATYGAMIMANANQFDRAYAILHSARERDNGLSFRRVKQLRHYDKVRALIVESENIRATSDSVGAPLTQDEGTKTP